MALQAQKDQKTTQAMEPRLFSIEETCRLLGGCSSWTIRKHLQRGNIRSTHLGQRVYVPLDEIERIKQEGLPRLSPEPRAT